MTSLSVTGFAFDFASGWIHKVNSTKKQKQDIEFRYWLQTQRQ